MTSKAWLSLLVGGVLSTGSAGAAQANAPSAPALSTAVRNGEIDSSVQPHPGASVQWGRAVAMVNAPADAVMALLHDYGSYKDFLPNFKASRVLSQRGSSALVYMQVSVMRGAAQIWVEVKLKERPVQGTTRTIDATMTKGNVDRFEAQWQVTPIDAQRTLVAFQILVDPDLPLPASFVDSENQKNARKVVGALRNAVTERVQRASLAKPAVASKP